MNAGRWIAQERGALEPEERVEPEIVALPLSFPLAERLSQEDFDALMRLKVMLPQGSAGSAQFTE